jgi:hypothetical protein
VSQIGNRYSINIFDIWNCIKIKFSVQHTRIHSQQSIRLTGGLEALGNWNKINPIELKEEFNARSRDELVTYSTVVNIEVKEQTDVFSFNYSYSLWSDNCEPEWERDPARRLTILSSEDYRGQQGLNSSFQFTNASDVFFINGIIDKNDGFFHKNFSVSQIGSSNVYMGPYPFT